ncbi:hypothetical protein BH18ACT12_BH18ACT12_12420 [soil metagenome]
MAASPGDGTELVHKRGRKLGQVDRLFLNSEPSCIEPREVEEVGSELGEPVDLLAHRDHELGLRSEVFLVQQLVIVGPELESEHLFELVVARGEHDDRHLALVP